MEADSQLLLDGVLPANVLRCSRCKKSLPIGRFAVDRSRKSGHQSACRQCKRESNADHYNGNRERYAKKLRKYRRDHREKYLAHKAVETALRHGRLQRPEHCTCCGKRCKPEAHHADYSRRLDVDWVCRKCHRRKD